MKTAEELIAALRNAMRTWASWEDGIPEDAGIADVYEEAGEWLAKRESADGVTDHDAKADADDVTDYDIAVCETALTALAALALVDDHSERTWSLHHVDQDVILVLRGVPDDVVPHLASIAEDLRRPPERQEPAPTTEEATR